MGWKTTNRLKPRETDIQKQILTFLHLNKICAWRNNNGGVWDPTRKTFRTSFTGRKGVSDILGVLPMGRFLAIEVKTPKGKLSPDQAVFLEEVTSLGGLAFKAESVNDVETALHQYLQTK